MHPSLLKLIKNGSLWSSATSDYRNKYLSNSSTQEVFFKSGLEEESKNLWFPAYGYVCEKLQALVNNDHNLKIAWISSNFTPSLDLLYAHNLSEELHVVFTPDKNKLFSFTRNVIKEKCFDIIISCLEKISFSQSRSLQLVAKESSSINIILRPAWEIESHSASFIKLLVTPGISSNWRGSNWNCEITKIKARL